MTKTELFSSLLAATGNLQPAAETTAAELDDLRRAFLQSFEHASPPPAATSSSAASRGSGPELDYLVAQHLSAPQPGQPVYLQPREVQVRIPIDPASPAATAGHAPVRSFGPFTNAAGKLIWYDLFTFPKWLHVRASASGDDLLLLPFTTPRTPVHNDIPIPAGSIWIPARGFSASAPAVAYAGVRIKGGTLTVGSGSHFQGDVLVTPAGSTTLRITLDSTPAAGPAAGPGAEAVAANPKLPATATFVLTPPAILNVRMDDSSVSLYGQPFTLTRNPAPPAYDAN